MSNNQLFDGNIREQFKGYTPQVPTRIWENIVKEREKRKPVGFWFTFFNGRNILLLTALLITAGSGAYLLLKNAVTKEANVTAVNVKQILAADIENSGNEKINSNPKKLNNTDNQNTAASLNNTAADAAKQTESGYNTLTTAASFKIKTYSPFAQAGENDIISYFNDKKKNTSATNTEYDISNTDLNGDNQTLQDNYLKILLFADVQKTGAERKSASLNKRFLPNIFLPDCPSIEKNAAGNKTYIEVYGGPDMAFRSLSDTGNSAYLQKRKESTSFSSAYSAGLRYTRVFNNGVSVRSGINYSQINEKFTLVQSHLVQITYIIDANGDTTGSFITTGTRYKTTINKFKTIDVPLLLGYEMGNGKFHANINAGVIVNAYSWQKGEVLDTAYNPVNITTGKTNSPYQYKTNIGMGFMAGVSVYYKLNEKIHVLAEPYFRYNLTPMSKENLTLKQKYNTAGLRVGLRVDLH